MALLTFILEQNKELPFLDVLMSRKSDDSLEHAVYRKPRRMDLDIHARHEHHHGSVPNYTLSFNWSKS
jgi:hypothetical protein